MTSHLRAPEVTDPVNIALEDVQHRRLLPVEGRVVEVAPESVVGSGEKPQPSPAAVVGKGEYASQTCLGDDRKSYL
jgi:hypothetical protein